MKHLRAFALVSVALAAAVPQVAPAQELQAVGNRQCAIPGTELYDLLAEQLPGCELYCTVENELVAGYETYPGLVFACADRRGVIVAEEDDDDPAGFSAAGIGALVGVGLLLGIAGGGGGATNNTQ